MLLPGGSKGDWFKWETIEVSKIYKGLLTDVPGKRFKEYN